jgi:hypothetical protein
MMNRWTTLLLLCFLCAAMDAPAQNWFQKLLKPDGQAAPKYKQIQFWDEPRQTDRGFRALFHTLPLEKQNQRVDERLHAKMALFLSSMCQEVVTLESFENPTQKMLAEAVLTDLAEEWKLKGSISPASLFAKLPFLNVDLLILMERTKYEQFWNKDKKYLMIGLNAGVFELDFGQALYNDRILTQVPWFGEQTSYAKAEQTALLKVADAMGERMDKAARIINSAREAELLAAQTAQKQEQKQAVQDRKLADQEFRAFIAQVEQFLKTYDEPEEFIALVQGDLSDMKQLLKKSNEKITAEDIAAREQLKAVVNDRLAQYQKWLDDQLRRQQDPIIIPRMETESDTPAALIPPFVPEGPLPIQEEVAPVTSAPAAQIPAGLSQGNPWDRRWLLPENWKPTPTPAPGSRRRSSLPTASVSEQNAALSSTPAHTGPGTGSRIPPVTIQPPIPREFIQQMQLNPQSVTDAIGGVTPLQPVGMVPSVTQPASATAPLANPTTTPPAYNPQLLPPVRVTESAD